MDCSTPGLPVRHRLPELTQTPVLSAAHWIGFPSGSVVKDLPASAGDREDPLEKEMATHPAFLPEKYHGQRSLEGNSPWGCKESDTTEWLNCNSSCSPSLQTPDVWSLSHTDQFSSVSWVSFNLTQFWHCIHGERVRSHRLRAQPRKTAPTSDASHKSRLLPVFLI